MIYLLSFIAGLNISTLIELWLHGLKMQEAEGKDIAYGLSFLGYIVLVFVASIAVYGIARYFGLG
jgi:hypothetical protein